MTAKRFKRAVAGAVSLLVLGLLLASEPAVASGAARAEGARLRLHVETSTSGYTATLVVLLVGAGRADVFARAEMRAPGHFMSVPARRLAVRKGRTYAGRLQFPMLGQWIITVTAHTATGAKATRRVSIRL